MTKGDTVPTTERFDLSTILPGPRHCVACAGRVCDGVLELEGVLDTDCDAEAGTLDVTYDPAVVPLAPLQLAVQRLALEAAGSVGHATYRLEGLD